MSVEVMSGGGGSPKLQTKTVTPSTSKQSVAPDTGYDGLSQITVNAMPNGSLNALTVNNNGLVTSSVGTSGYLSSGTSKTLQLPTQSSITITPGTSTKTAVSSGQFTTGAVYVQGDSNLIPENIAYGVSIFGVTGTRQDYYFSIWQSGRILFSNTQTIYWNDIHVPSNAQIQSISIIPNGGHVPSDGGIYAYLDGYYAMGDNIFQPDGYKYNVGFSHQYDQNSLTFYMTINNSNFYWSSTYYMLNLSGYVMSS